MPQCVLRVEGMTKRFPGTVALSKARLEVFEGEAMALVGENGAGKSTLMNIVSGVLQGDEGSVSFLGEEVKFNNPRESMNAGIGFVHQELALCQHLSAAENIYMGKMESDGAGLINWSKLYERADSLLSRFHVDFKSSRKVSTLSVAQQQVIEIAKALSMEAKLIIFDEPTSSLTDTETRTLFKIIKELKASGIAIVYISHRMAEIFQFCDRITVMRDGNYVTTMLVSESNEEMIIRSMVGREITDLFPAKNSNGTGKELLSVMHFCGNRFTDVSFSLYKNEILGFSGLVGAGRSEVARAICGIDKIHSGELFIEGKKTPYCSYRKMIDKGICYLTEDRKKNGLFLQMSIRSNITVALLDQIATRGFLYTTKEDEIADDQVSSLGVKISTTKQAISSLSGGNQQKAMIGKWLAVRPKIIFMDEPTRGIDVGAKNEIHRLLRKLASQGVGIVIISSEMPEIIGMSDRIVVMHEGKVTGILGNAQITEENIIMLASGKSKLSEG